MTTGSKPSRRKRFAKEGLGKSLETLSDINVVIKPIAELRRDPRLQMRRSKDDKAIAEYAQNMAGTDRKGYVIDHTGERFPEVRAVNDDGKLYIYDGFHRLDAADERSIKKFQVSIRPGTFDEALLLATRANLPHGVRFTNEDKNRAVTSLLKSDTYGPLSSEYLAELAGVSAPLVSGIRKELIIEGIIPYRPRLIGKDGKKYSAGDNPLSEKPKASPKSTVKTQAPVNRTQKTTLQPLGGNSQAQKEHKANPLENSIDIAPGDPQDETELPYNPVEISPPKAEQAHEVETHVTGTPGRYLLVDHMSKADWQSLASRLNKERLDTFIAPLPRYGSTDPLQWVAKYTGALDGRTFKQAIIVGQSVYLMWSSNDLEVLYAYAHVDELIADLESART